MNKLYGAILGDLAGQPYEYKYKGDFSEFNIHNSNSHITDDTIMTLATAAYLLNDFASFKAAYLAMFLKYPGDFYGKGFSKWAKNEIAMEESFNESYGNGCLMRVSPCMYLDYSIRLETAIESCLVSHSHAQSVIAIDDLHNLYTEYSRTRRKFKPFRIKQYLETTKNKFDVTAKGTIIIVKDLADISLSTQDAITKAVKHGGDTDTNASIVGELINFTFNDLKKEDIEYVESKLDRFQLDILKRFNKKFN